jgi:hypothetical protein
MNTWLKLALQALSMVPAVIQTVEQIHANASGASKKEIALNYLGLGTAVAATVSPEHTDTFVAVSNGVGNMIDQAVAIANAVGHFKTTPKPAPAPALVPAAVPAPAPAPTTVADATGDSTPTASTEVIEGPGLHTTA